ncbi:MAG: class I SAM-dependent methyltransferase [Actinomycetota bacterium]
MAGHRLFAAMYDRMLAAQEKAGLRDMRAELLSEARGRSLEVGAGTGLNLPHYTDAVTELVFTEPDPHMAKRLRRRAAEAGLPSPVEVIEAGAEDLPFEDASFDTVVATLVFCTVSDPGRATAEAARLLRPGGQLLLLEHVRAEEGSRRARWQDRLERPWGWVGAGCHPNRDTASTLGARFDVSGLAEDTLPGSAPPIVKPLIRGVARPA